MKILHGTKFFRVTIPTHFKETGNPEISSITTKSSLAILIVNFLVQY